MSFQKGSISEKRSTSKKFSDKRLSKKCSIKQNNFSTELAENYEKLDCQSPKIRIWKKSQIDFSQINPGEVAVYISEENENILEIIFVKWFIGERQFQALANCMPIFHTKILRLEYCNITSDQIKTLTENLKNNKILTEISLNGNPNKEQNFHLLLDLPILSLNLRFCKITSKGAKTLAEAFNNSNIKLVHLDLSSNDLNNDGAEFVANIIRVNRTLKAFNLADNKLNDIGCGLIMKAFQKFPLSQSEIIIKRKIKLNLVEIVPTIKNSKLFKKPSDKNIRKGSSGKRSSKEKSSKTSLSSKKSIKSSSISVQMKISQHPFLVDTVEENNAVNCKGNGSMTHLNLSYNNITEAGLKLILNTLVYQNEIFNKDGLVHIKLDDNEFEKTCEEISQISEQLAKKFAVSETNLSTSQVSLDRKRKSSGNSGKRSLQKV